jgi:toxin ParE1/3/4
VANKFIRKPLAQADLIEIWKFIAKDNEKSADKFLDKIETTLFMLQDNPCAGRARPELGEAMRSIPVGRYAIYYRSLAQKLELVRVFHNYRDTKTLLK